MKITKCHQRDGSSLTEVWLHFSSFTLVLTSLLSYSGVVSREIFSFLFIYGFSLNMSSLMTQGNTCESNRNHCDVFCNKRWNLK